MPTSCWPQLWESHGGRTAAGELCSQTKSPASLIDLLFLWEFSFHCGDRPNPNHLHQRWGGYKSYKQRRSSVGPQSLDDPEFVSRAEVLFDSTSAAFCCPHSGR